MAAKPPKANHERVAECIYRRGRSLHLCVNGRWTRLGPVSLSVAKGIRDRLRHDQASDCAGVERDTRPITVAELLETYRTSRVHYVSSLTLRRLDEHVVHLARLLGPLDARRVQRRDLADYQTARLDERIARRGQKISKQKTTSNATVNRELTILGAAYRLGIKDKVVRENPVVALDPLPEPRSEDVARPPTVADLRAILAEALSPRRHGLRRWLPDLIALAMGTGERLTALLSVRVKDVDFAQSVVQFPAKSRKGGKTYATRRLAPLPPFAVAVLRGRVTGRRPDDYIFPATRDARRHIGRSAAWGAFVQVCEAAGVDPAPRVHDLRHAVVTSGGAEGFGEQQLADYMGYNGTAMIKRYTHLQQRPEAGRPVADALERLYGFFTPGLSGDSDDVAKSSH